MNKVKEATCISFVLNANLKVTDLRNNQLRQDYEYEINLSKIIANKNNSPKKKKKKKYNSFDIANITARHQF